MRCRSSQGLQDSPLQQWVAPLLKPMHAARARARARTSGEPIEIALYTSLRGVHLEVYTTLSECLPCALRACTHTDAHKYTHTLSWTRADCGNAMSHGTAHLRSSHVLAARRQGAPDHANCNRVRALARMPKAIVLRGA